MVGFIWTAITIRLLYLRYRNHLIYYKYMPEPDNKKIWLFFIFLLEFFYKRRVIVNELYFLYPQNSLTAAHHTYTSNTPQAPHSPPGITDDKLSTYTPKVAQNGSKCLLEGRFWVDGAHMGMVQIIEHKFCITE